MHFELEDHINDVGCIIPLRKAVVKRLREFFLLLQG